MSSYTYPTEREGYNTGYENEKLDYDDYEASPSSVSNAMTATNFSQSMSSTSSYAASPSGQWDRQQQCYVHPSNTMPSYSAPENQDHIQSRAYSQQQSQSVSDNREYVDQLRYAPQQQPPTQDLPPNQRSAGRGSSSPPRYVTILPFLPYLQRSFTICPP